MHFDKIRQTEPCVDGEVRLTDALTKKQSVKFTARFSCQSIMPERSLLSGFLIQPSILENFAEVPNDLR